MNGTDTKPWPTSVADATARAVARSRALALAVRAVTTAEARLIEALSDPDVDMAAYLTATAGDA